MDVKAVVKFGYRHSEVVKYSTLGPSEILSLEQTWYPALLEEHKQLASQRQFAHLSLQVRQQRDRNLCDLLGTWRKVRLETERHTFGRRGHLHLLSKIQGWNATAEGRKQKLQAFNNISQGPYGINRGNLENLRHTIRDGRLQRRSKHSPGRINTQFRHIHILFPPTHYYFSSCAESKSNS